MPEVVQFKRETDAGVIEALKQALDEAERGDLTHIVMVKVRYDGSFSTRSDGKTSQRELVGSLVFAAWDIINSNHTCKD